jgi:hypothetical protein
VLLVCRKETNGRRGVTALANLFEDREIHLILRFAEPSIETLSELTPWEVELRVQNEIVREKQMKIQHGVLDLRVFS